MIVTLTSHTPNPEQAIIEAAATCWQSVPNEQILDHIIKAGHWTPLEFAVFNFRIDGVSRALTHQLVRKRVGVAFAQESQRYVKYEDGFEYVTPHSVRENEFVNREYHNYIRGAGHFYEFLLNNGVPAEDARFVLPNACTSTISMSINYHALLDLAKERLCSRAQWEIRSLVLALKAEVAEASPKLAGYLMPKCYWSEGKCNEIKPCGQHKSFIIKTHERCQTCRNIYCQRNKAYEAECRTNFFCYYQPKGDL